MGMNKFEIKDTALKMAMRYRAEQSDQLPCAILTELFEWIAQENAMTPGELEEGYQRALGPKSDIN